MQLYKQSQPNPAGSICLSALDLVGWLQFQLGDGNWILVATTGQATDQPTADEDRILFDGRLAIAGIKFRFLQAKGLEFAEPLRDFSTRLNKLAGRANARVLDLESETDGGVVQ